MKKFLKRMIELTFTIAKILIIVPCSVLYWYILKNDKRNCGNCDYKRKMEYGNIAGQWHCTASCGNQDGKLCNAWFPRSLAEKWRKDDD